MNDRTGWRQVTCAESDTIRHAASGVLSSLTDPQGLHGQAVVFTEWDDADARPALRDYRWTDPDRPCEHLVPIDTEDGPR